MNKTIYMTYKKAVPLHVFERWKKLNKDYAIDFSMDEQCITFLENNFNPYIASLFKSIKLGMFKADLWRLCKLYISSGVYADIDLVPYINIDTLDKDVTFYTCLTSSHKSIFQAFIVNNSKPNNPLILCCLISFLINKPYDKTGIYTPTYDMYNCLKYNLNVPEIKADIKYKINVVKIPINIGPSNTNTKIINLFYFPDNIEYTINLKKNQFKDTFIFKISDNKLYVIRIDENTGWAHPHSIDICIDSKECIYLFNELYTPGKSIDYCYVAYKNNKILDSRDHAYFKNKGW